MELGNYTNRSKAVHNDKTSNLYTHPLALNVLYSVKLREINHLFKNGFKSAETARKAFIVLNHFNSYHRNLQNDICRLYGFSQKLVKQILEVLTKAGLLTAVNCKRKTNIGAYVEFRAYQISLDGRKVADLIKNIVECNIEKLSKAI